jgi:cysteinyl-tRNA synthetase
MAVFYQQDMIVLGCTVPDVEPKVSQHVPDIIQFIEALIAAGSAYAVDMPGGTRDVYYAVRTFSGYGKLSKRNIEELLAGARVAVCEEKHDPLDFALWKGCTEDAWGWPSPWGKGRPGWHIECSAMASRYLGHGFDVHCGGMDLIFPHHENEIAQSEAACPTSGPFASMWVHNGLVNIDKEKMAKSLGNFVTIRDVLSRNDPEALRYFVLSSHYRGPVNFDVVKLPDGRVLFPGVIEAERRVDYLYGTIARLSLLADSSRNDEGDEADSAGSQAPSTTRMSTAIAGFIQAADAARAQVDAALDDDLNTPVALAAVAEVARTANELIDFAQKKRKEAGLAVTASAVARMLLIALKDALQPLGLLQASPEEYRARTEARRLAILARTPEQIAARLQERARARADKDFARADAIRKELEADRIEVFDTPAGTTYRVGI